MVSRWCRVVSQWCRGGVPVVSRWCNDGPVPVLSRWCPSDVPVVFLWCLGGVSVSQCWSGRVRCAGGVPVVSWSCPGGVPVVLQNVQWCLGSVPVVGVPVAVVSRAVVCFGSVPVSFPDSHQVWGLLLTRFMFVLASCPGGVLVVLLCVQWCPGGVPVVGVPVVSRWCRSGVSWCSSGVQWCPGGWCPSRVPVVSQWRLVVFQWCPVVSRWLLSQWCLGGVPVLFQWCPGRVPVVSPCSLGPGWWCSTTFHPVVSRLCPVFHGVVSRSRPPFRKICNCGAVGVLLVRWLEGLRWGGEVVGVLFGDACSVLYVVVIGVSVGALALKKLARTFLLSCHDVFAELVAACNSHRLLLLPVSHSPGKHYTAYLVENGFRQISRNEHLFAESISLHQFLYLPSSHQV